MCEEAGIWGRKLTLEQEKQFYYVHLYMQGFSKHKSSSILAKNVLQLPLWTTTVMCLSISKRICQAYRVFFHRWKNPVETAVEFSDAILIDLISCSGKFGTMHLILTLWITCLQHHQCHFLNGKSCSQAPLPTDFGKQ